MLSNILVVKDLYGSFTYSLTIERTRNSILDCSRSQFTFLYRSLMAHKRKRKLFLRFRYYAFEDAERTTWKWLNGLGKYEQLMSLRLRLHGNAFVLFLKLFSTTLAMTYAQIVSLHVHVSGSTIQDIIHDLQWNTKMSKGLTQYNRNHIKSRAENFYLIWWLYTTYLHT